MNGLKSKLVRQFWIVRAPLIGISAVVMWLVWHVVVGNTWPAWAAALIPVLGGLIFIYPRSGEKSN